jgi:hypothetical protein
VSAWHETIRAVEEFINLQVEHSCITITGFHQKLALLDALERLRTVVGGGV